MRFPTAKKLVGYAGLGSNHASVAIARKLLVEVWYVLSERVGDRHVTSEMAASKRFYLLTRQLIGCQSTFEA